jgi:hypothetical protein
MKKKLALSSIKRYQMLLRLFCSDLDLLNPYKTFIKLHFKISEKNKSYISKKTIANVLCAINWKISETYGFDNSKYFIDMYRIIIFHIKKLCDYDVKNHLKNADKIPLWENVIKKRDYWLGVYDYTKYLISCVYTMLPPRRVLDYGKMIIINSLNDIINENRNYYCFKESVFVFYIYKTKNIYGKKIFKLPSKLNNIIKDFIKMNNIQFGDSLFGIKNLNDSEQQEFKSLINKTFGFGVDYLRHSFISYMYKDKFIEINKIEEIANLMGHSVETNLKYRKNINNNVNITDNIDNKIVKNKFLNYVNPNKLHRQKGLKYKKTNLKIQLVNTQFNNMFYFLIFIYINSVNKLL